MTHYTERQLRLFYREAIKRERFARADRVEEISAGFGGGKEVERWVRRLREC